MSTGPHFKSSDDIRREFLSFFEEKGHTVVPSASIVPFGDATLMFTNAGMNQFKDVFLGEGSRSYSRAADTQKCLRVSGKHNDLEEVGKDTYHHTFFEMLGNWSFGDYFKKEAIQWAWELLVERWGLEPSRMYATVHEGDEDLGLEADLEAEEYWRSLTSLTGNHILRCHSGDNFWMMGDTGPCGPCTEIHYDMRSDEERAKVPGHTLVNADDPRVIEIWNLVFIQYNALGKDAGLEPLTAKHVDTGMGFERIACVMQGKMSNYDTDLFAPILQATADLSPDERIKGYEDIEAEGAALEKIRIAMRVIADHVRTIAIAIGDSVTPSNTGRGYVIRRILRRAVRYGYTFLGFEEPFLYKLVEQVREKMGHQFPELDKYQRSISRITQSEEESFLKVLKTGLEDFDNIVRVIQQIKADLEEMTPEQEQFVTQFLPNLLPNNFEEGAKIASVLQGLLERTAFTKELFAEGLEAIGKFLFGGEADKAREAAQKKRDELLMDSQAIDLLRKAFKDRGNTVAGFVESARKGIFPGEVAFLLHDTYGFPMDLTRLMVEEQGLTFDKESYDACMEEQREKASAAAKFKVDYNEDMGWQEVKQGDDSAFVGYDHSAVEGAQIHAVRAAEDKEGKTFYHIVLDQTPFYAESGGQIGDTGTLVIGDQRLDVLDTQKVDGRIVHIVERMPEALDAPVSAQVDSARRARISKHHTATHLLHAALREVLGPHVNQQGSLVAPGRLRFDFSHFERISPQELRDIEQRINEVIQANVKKGEDRDVPIEDALNRGARALFGEKYGESVRVITFDPGYSVELCGGIHCATTGEIGVFRFLGESAIASGSRRVEAIVGQDAVSYIQDELDALQRVRTQVRSTERPIDEEVAALLDQSKQLEKEVARMRQELLEGKVEAFIEQAHTMGDARLVTGRLDDVDAGTLKELAQRLRDRLTTNTITVLGSAVPGEGKVYLAAFVSDDLIASHKQLKAGALVGKLAKIVGGGGGGRPTLATAGGRQPEKLDEALAQAQSFVQEALSA